MCGQSFILNVKQMCDLGFFLHHTSCQLVLQISIQAR